MPGFAPRSSLAARAQTPIREALKREPREKRERNRQFSVLNSFHSQARDKPAAGHVHPTDLLVLAVQKI